MLERLKEAEEKERQLQNLKQQLAQIQHKKATNRTRIPTSGKAWIDREDIAWFFESQSNEERKVTQKRYSNATHLVTLRKQKLAECIRKRKEVEKLEEEGNLPKRRKTGSALLEEESRLVEQIAEAERRVKKFEKHLEELMQDVGEAERLIGSPEEEAESGEDFEEGAGAD
ncbi:hypothetical protein HOY80DRAFT_1002428 [Tuber brumale]|nr:hypothetical protein HOY80DRAFT_1002428 [Tuber brumale]